MRHFSTANTIQAKHKTFHSLNSKVLTHFTLDQMFISLDLLQLGLGANLALSGLSKVALPSGLVSIFVPNTSHCSTS